jgi:hypothetical protein
LNEGGSGRLKQTPDAALWVAAGVSLVISLTPWAPVLLYPFRLFTTWAHECAHALAAVLVGGQVLSVAIAPDTSGVTHSLLPAGRLARGVVASAGYLGAAAVGCLLMAATRVERAAPAVLGTIATLMLLSLGAWVRNLFGALVVLAWAAALIALARRGIGPVPRFALGLLAVQVALNSVFDIRVLFLVAGTSDAATMAELFLAPAWFWAGAWIAMALAMLLATLWLTTPGAPGPARADLR